MYCTYSKIALQVFRILSQKIWILSILWEMKITYVCIEQMFISENPDNFHIYVQECEYV